MVITLKLGLLQLLQISARTTLRVKQGEQLDYQKMSMNVWGIRETYQILVLFAMGMRGAEFIITHLSEFKGII